MLTAVNVVLDNKNLQESYVFKGLKPKTTYTIYQKYMETDEMYASVLNELVGVTTYVNLCNHR